VTDDGVNELTLVEMKVSSWGDSALGMSGTQHVPDEVQLLGY
jgi:hypothetical protein